MLNWLTWFRWATLILVFVAASYYGYQTTPWSCVDTTVTAYWVQAIGSVAAILGAVEIFRRQNIATSRLSVRERQSNIHQRQISVYAICVAAYELIEELHRCHQVDSKFGEVSLIITKISIVNTPFLMQKRRWLQSPFTICTPTS